MEDILKKYQGPGAYDPTFKLVEARTDIGYTQMPDLNDKNSREALLNPMNNRDIFDNEDLYPNIDAIKPNIKSF